MKKFIILSLTISFIMASCSKPETAQPKTITNTVFQTVSIVSGIQNIRKITGFDSNTWSYIDIIIPIGLKTDSIYVDADRVGYPDSENDMIVNYVASNSYDDKNAIPIYNYQQMPNSMYHVWLKAGKTNGVIRVALPTNAGVIFHSIDIASSPTSN